MRRQNYIVLKASVMVYDTVISDIVLSTSRSGKSGKLQINTRYSSAPNIKAYDVPLA